MPLNRTNFANRRTIFEFSAENAKSADWLADEPVRYELLSLLDREFSPILPVRC